MKKHIYKPGHYIYDIKELTDLLTAGNTVIKLLDSGRIRRALRND